MTLIVYPDLLIRPRREQPEVDGPTPVKEALALGACYLLLVGAITFPVLAFAASYRVNLFDDTGLGTRPSLSPA